MTERSFRTFKIGGTSIGRGEPPFILAEIGINHQGNVGMANEMVCRAAAACAHGVKLQSFTADRLAHRERAADQHELFGKVELSEAAHRRLRATARECGVAFVSTPFDTEWARRLVHMGADAIKVASGDLTNLPLLDEVARLGLPVILSTGMGSISEIRRARARLLHGGADRLVILHCVSLYPTMPHELNLDAMTFMMREFPEPVGLSDHTVGTWAAIAATALGASLIEKHFTLDKTLPGDDHVLAVTPHELADLVEQTANVHNGIGSWQDKPCPRELKRQAPTRRGLYAARDIKAGERIRLDNLDILRPTATISPGMIDEIVGRPAACDIAAGAPIEPDDLGVQDEA